MSAKDTLKNIEHRKNYYDKNRGRIQEYDKERNKNRDKEKRNKHLKEPEIRAAYRNRYLKSYYGITLEDYALLLGEQDGVCAICGNTETARHKSGEIKSLSVDHDHNTGQIRGLLCYKCNIGLGHFGDNMEYLQKAICYLSQTEKIRL